jgi:hypothetical protein
MELITNSLLVNICTQLLSGAHVLYKVKVQADRYLSFPKYQELLISKNSLSKHLT